MLALQLLVVAEAQLKLLGLHEALLLLRAFRVRRLERGHLVGTRVPLANVALQLLLLDSCELCAALLLFIVLVRVQKPVAAASYDWCCHSQCALAVMPSHGSPCCSSAKAARAAVTPPCTNNAIKPMRVR